MFASMQFIASIVKVSPPLGGFLGTGEEVRSLLADACATLASFAYVEQRVSTTAIFQNRKLANAYQARCESFGKSVRYMRIRVGRLSVRSGKSVDRRRRIRAHSVIIEGHGSAPPLA